MASSPGRARTRAQRVASRIEYNGFSKRLRKLLFDDNGPQKLALICGAAILITIIGGSWNPPLKFKLFSSPDRDVVCNTNFSAVNARQTSENKSIALKSTPHYYVNDKSRLDAYKKQLRHEMQIILGITDIARATADERKTIREYLPPRPTPEEEESALDKLQNYFDEDVDLANFNSALDKVFAPYEERGVIKKLHPANQGNQEFVKVYDVAKSEEASVENRRNYYENPDGFSEIMDRRLNAVQVRTPEILFGNGLVVRNELNDVFEHDRDLIELFFERIRKSPPETLSEDVAATKFAQAEEVAKVAEVRQYFVVGEPIVRANDQIGVNEYEWLKEERASYLHSRLAISRILRFLATLILNALLLVGAHLVVVVKQPIFDVKADGKPIAKTAIFLGLFVFFFLVGRAAQIALPNKGTLVELMPVVVFVELATFAISWGVSLTIGVLLSLMLTFSSGGGLEVFVPLCGTAAFVAFLSRSVRTRLQLVFLALDTGFFAFLLSMAAGLLANDFMRPTYGESGYAYVFADFARASSTAFHHAIWAAMGGVLTTCLLPIVELYFHVVTPMQLLEYANPSHPLMIELNQRAPSTYNHSLQTSYLAEAAAEAIGARSYLVKVGAYFHDVGKMMNPEYFTENQNGRNIHDELEPRMSALVIVAHVKDGVNLGEKYKLPREIIDLIEQHHGTMLVSFFYQQALKAAQAQDPDARLDESPFRYPGPIPQSKEAGILMLSDAVESASRSLTEWTPRRVENLVRKITEARIEDGQFRDSGLTFGEVQLVQQSLVSSLLASRHTRVKYPDADKDSKDGEKNDESKGGKDENDRSVKSDGSKGSSSEGSQIIRSERLRGDGSSISDDSTILKIPH